jgi:hypothetical protein
MVVVFGAGVALVGGEALGPHGGGGTSSASYLVSYSNGTQSLSGASGNAPLRTTTDIAVEVTLTNLTNVTFHISYQDNTISPLFNPAVTATITGPGGAGTATDSVTAQGVDITVTIPNTMPGNATVDAASPEEALAKAATGNNATLGTGEWTVALQVGSPLGPRPGGSITYDISIEVEYFVGTATRA